MNGDDREPATFSLARRWGAGLNLVITLAAVLAIVAMVNYLGMRHFVRAHWTRGSDTELSKRTRQVLASLTNDVKVVTYFNSEDGVFPRVRALLKEYENASAGRVRVQHVDYIRQPVLANTIRSTYNITDADRDVVIFDGVRRVRVSGMALSDYDTSGLMSGKTNEVPRTHFKGELLFTSKIYESSLVRSPKAYFLLGHFEHSPSEAAGAQSYSKFAGILRNENNFEVQPLDLLTQKEVPTDCNLLIIAGPTQTFNDEEVERISRYLEGGGRLLVLFNYRSLGPPPRPSGLEKLLASWGIDVGQNIVIDVENSSNGSGIDPRPVNLGQHPIVNSLGNSRVMLVLPRSMRAVPANSRRRDEATIDELLFTGPKTQLRANLAPTSSAIQSPPVSLAVAVERSIPAVERGATRIVAIGDSSLWENDIIDLEGNREFASSTANWLVQQNLLLSEIPRRAIRTQKLSLTASELRNARVVLLAGMPGAVLFIGFLVWVRRRK